MCLQPYAEQPYPRPRVPRGAFDCDHALCYKCHRALALSSDSAVAYRCPLCRAAPANEAAPLWARAELARPEVAAARAAAAALEAVPLVEIRRAESAAAEHASLLMRLMDGDREFERIRASVRDAAASFIVQLGQDVDDEGEYFDDDAQIGEVDDGALPSEPSDEEVRQAMAARLAAEQSEAARRPDGGGGGGGGPGSQMQFLRAPFALLRASRPSSPTSPSTSSVPLLPTAPARSRGVVEAAVAASDGAVSSSSGGPGSQMQFLSQPLGKIVLPRLLDVLRPPSCATSRPDSPASRALEA